MPFNYINHRLGTMKISAVTKIIICYQTMTGVFVGISGNSPIRSMRVLYLLMYTIRPQVKHK